MQLRGRARLGQGTHGRTFQRMQVGRITVFTTAWITADVHQCTGPMLQWVSAVQVHVMLSGGVGVGSAGPGRMRHES